jgi:hypothetical protein
MRGVLIGAAAVAALALAFATLTLRAAVAPPAGDSGHARQDIAAQQESAGDPADEESDAGYLDPLGPNAACYVCHMTFVDEPLAVTHLRAKITCIDCHGTSQGHANDEKIGATKPDIVIPRSQLNRACRKCHERHDVRPEEVIARWIKRARSRQARPAGKPLRPPVVCTDCHGSHRVSRAQQDRVPHAK